MMTEPGVDLVPGQFLDAWNTIRTLRQEILVPAQCTGCELRHICDQCPAMCYAETGSFTKVPHYTCQRTRAYLNLIQSELEQN